MKDKKVLQKAIEIAVRNGMKNYDIGYDCELFDNFENWWCINSVGTKYYKLIFHHGFAKAFWGDRIDEGMEE